MIKVIYCKPNERAEIIETSTDYGCLCNLLGCEELETMELLIGRVIILCNGEGKLCRLLQAELFFRKMN